MKFLRTSIAIGLAMALAGCGQGQPGPKGDPGPAGPPGAKGDAGPPGTAAPIRIIRVPCNEANCAAQCNENEVLINAYCGTARNPAFFPNERSATCRARVAVNSPLVVICVKSP